MSVVVLLISCHIISFQDSFIMQDRRTKQTVGVEYVSQGLYCLTSLNPTRACPVIDAPDLIHKRLGYSSLLNVQKIVPSLSILDCESCKLRKHTRTTFLRSVESCVESIFSLVHFDIWGHTSQQNQLNLRISLFCSFIDDNSRVIVLKYKINLVSLFVPFVVMISSNICPPSFNRL